jgi:hypothetical protein
VSETFFSFSSFFSFALTVWLGLVPWHSDCCYCSAPRRRLRVQKGGSCQGDVSPCWHQNWGDLHAGIFFFVWACDGFTILPSLFSRVSCFLCLFSVFILLLSRFMCYLSSRGFCLVSLRSSLFDITTSIVCLIPCTVSRITYLHYLLSVLILIVSPFMCYILSRVLSLVSLLSSRFYLPTSLVCLLPSPSSLLSYVFCIFYPVSSVVYLSCCLLYLMSSLFCVSFHLLLSSCLCCLFSCVSSILSLPSSLIYLHCFIFCLLFFLFALLSFFVSLLSTASSLLSVVVVPFLFPLYYFLVSCGALKCVVWCCFVSLAFFFFLFYFYYVPVLYPFPQPLF